MTTPFKPPAPDIIKASILDLAAARGPAKSICPSEVARILSGPLEPGQWQSLLTPVRQAAISLAKAGRIDILRKGRPVPPEEVRGVIRLRIKGDAS
jgi:hypothetical protein